MKFSTGQNDDDDADDDDDVDDESGDDDDEDCVSNDEEKVAPAARATQEMKTASLRIILQLWIQDWRSTGKKGSTKISNATRRRAISRLSTAMHPSVAKRVKC